MIELLKSLPALISVSVAGLAAAAIAPLFVISSRMLAVADEPPVGDAVKPSTTLFAAVERSPVGAQWRQIAQGIEGHIQRLRTTVDRQSAACIQLDAADFALGKIVEELAAIMPSAPELRRLTPSTAAVPQRALAA